ncbi:MAG: RT0821/Lpp0805 family surface protein [Burkholderiales bacterium]
MTSKYLIAAFLALPFVGACESYSPSKEDVGMVTGAVLGGVLGHQIGGGTGKTVATIGGAVLGGFLGSQIGRKMDRDDQLKTAQALETSRAGQTTTWRNPDTGQTYSVTPTQTHQSPSGPCRDFKTVTEIDGREEVVHGTACRQPDGTWRTA